MAIEKSLGLANKLEECADISKLYSEQVTSMEEQRHFIELEMAIRTIKRIHILCSRYVKEIDVISRYED